MTHVNDEILALLKLGLQYAETEIQCILSERSKSRVQSSRLARHERNRDRFKAAILRIEEPNKPHVPPPPGMDFS